jgi:hypothetical protein
VSQFKQEIEKKLEEESAACEDLNKQVEMLSQVKSLIYNTIALPLYNGIYFTRLAVMM